VSEPVDTGANRGAGPTRSPGSSRLELLLAAVLPVCAVLYLWQALTVPEPPRLLQVSVGAFPVVVAIALVASALLCAVVTLRDRRPAAAPPTDAGSETEVSSWRDVIVGIGALIALPATFEPLGYVVVATAFIGGVATYYAPEKLVRNLVVGIALAIASYVLFTRYLGILLPPGAVLSALGLE
jgi:putative tricarboxylic transport membrane protein